MKQIIILLLGVLSACAPYQVPTTSEKSVAIRSPNVIFFIGDGMGLAQVSAAIQESDKPLHLEGAEAIGLIKTASSAQQITDSAAAATAFSIGEKTVNDSVGVGADGVPKETILELLAGRGYATGVIATSTITHATPASFYAHVKQRGNYYKIAEALVAAPVTLFIGGGRNHFDKRSDPKKGMPDERNLLNEFTSQGGTLINSIDQLAQQRGRVGLFIADDDPAPRAEGRGDILQGSIEPSINYLRSQSEKGFFMLVEGSQIDWGGHMNDFAYANSELLDFDSALGAALAFARSDGNTLVLVTADHETGGLTLPTSDIESADPYSDASYEYSTIGHTATMVPVYAFGRGAENFSGVYDNTEIYSRLVLTLSQ